MADSQPFQSVELYDEISTFEAGMDSGTDPELLPKNQLSFAINATVRGGYVKTRPPYSKTHLNVAWPDEATQEAFEQGLFQGAGYYNPDTGSQSLFASVAGRLYQFQITGNSVAVADKTITGDPNPEAVTQAWLWQSENFLIVNDGQSLPVIFDGANTRRSYGPSVEVGNITPGTEIIPDVGATRNVLLSSTFTGRFNEPVLISGFYYQAIESTAGYLVEATCLFDIPGTAIPVGATVYTKPSIAWVIAGPVSLSGSFAVNATLNFNITSPFLGSVGNTVIIFDKVWRVTAKSGNTVSVAANQSGTYTSLSAGTQIQYSSSSAPNVLIGTVVTASVAPSIGATVQLRLSNAFSGTLGQVVYIGTEGQYSIVAVPPPPPGGTSIDLLNINDSRANGVATFGNNTKIYSVPELPAGRMGTYGLGQNWICLVDGFSFICSDQSRGPSGTQANSFRDAVLKTVDLTFRGGNFAIPGAGNVITSMTFTANLDLSLGQGSLQVGTAAFMASCQAPIDFSNPPANGPILTFSLIGQGPLAQNSTIRVNSDVYFRSTIGLGSLIQARRDFNVPGNTPISHEMERVIDLDDQTLLNYSTATNFDNRDLHSCSPQASSRGVLHAGLMAMNLDSLSTLRGKAPPVYDGLWTGINVLQLVSGLFNGKERCFAFTFNVALSKLELYELLPSNSDEVNDDGIIPIVTSFESPCLFNKDIKSRMQKVRLINGEFAVDEVIGIVRFEVYYRFDKSCWVPWHAFSICADTAGEPQYFPRLGLGEPSSETCDPILNTPAREGFLLQVKFVITGHCRFLRGKFCAVTLPQEKFAPVQCDETIQVETIEYI